MGQGMGARWLPSLRLYSYTVSHPRRFRRPAALYAPQAELQQNSGHDPERNLLAVSASLLGLV